MAKWRGSLRMNERGVFRVWANRIGQTAESGNACKNITKWLNCVLQKEGDMKKKPLNFWKIKKKFYKKIQPNMFNSIIL